jgi:Flp pilus assembly protein TadG
MPADRRRMQLPTGRERRDVRRHDAAASDRAAYPSRTMRRDRRGVASVEFAIIGSLLTLATISVVGVGLLMWTQTGLQSVAMLAARCGAVGVTTGIDCATTSATQTYAVTQAGSWVPAGAITASDVTATNGATSCNGATGTFYKVTVVSSLLSNVVPILPSSMTLSATACIPLA